MLNPPEWLQADDEKCCYDLSVVEVNIYEDDVCDSLLTLLTHISFIHLMFRRTHGLRFTTLLGKDTQKLFAFFFNREMTEISVIRSQEYVLFLLYLLLPLI